MTAYVRAYRACRRAGGTREEARRAGDAAWHVAHREEDNARGRARHAAHREERKAQMRAWRAAHREDHNAMCRAWYAAHRTEIAIYAKQVHVFDTAMAEAVLATFSMLPRDRQARVDFANGIMTDRLCKASSDLDSMFADLLNV